MLLSLVFLHLSPSSAVLDEGYRRALAVPSNRLFPQFDLAQHGGLLEASAGEVQWAAFYSDCLHEVLPVTDGARVTLAWELFAYPADAALNLPAQTASLPNGADSLLHALRLALDSNSFFVNGGRLGFPLQDVPAMLKGADAALVHVLQALGLRFQLLRVWQDDSEETCGGWEPPVADAEPSRKALFVSAIQPASLHVPSDEGEAYHEAESSWLEEEMCAKIDCSIVWLGGQEDIQDWTVGAAYRFYFGNYPTSVHEFYCTLGLVAEIPPYDERPDRTAAQLAWAGAGAAARRGGSGDGGGGSASPASPASKKAKTG
ncbi:2OG-Fe(II) oxygenase family [Chlorella sorokiniana]|uniref:2OG-Fe(II) oxygenase family n=1 Tax=Chlorella sorokiniana TaxID=3076 RepID=A0A2P6TQ21_CHLSO|nr:2OG-Fe(II) oxygenase family [Chlorella sorokiniana]|eukprot:PRW56124.1 2OG-Fe(II) oxygenase family [Chlorella sorokiniana]